MIIKDYSGEEKYFEFIPSYVFDPDSGLFVETNEKAENLLKDTEWVRNINALIKLPGYIYASYKNGVAKLFIGILR